MVVNDGGFILDKAIVNNPSARVLINSMRSIGYEFESAVSDIIDNSITAGAKKIHIRFPISDEDRLFLQIFDDGKGMSRAELVEAMRFGTIKEGIRDVNDLGRFGLGLKTASISQCRKFSVITKKDGKTIGFYWDLDSLTTNDWNMFEMTNISIEAIPNINYYLPLSTFTLVMWEKIDSLDSETNLNFSQKDVFDRKIKSTIEHVEVIFHRYIQQGLVIKFNELISEIKDPFLTNHKKTTIKPEQEIQTKTKNGEKEKIHFQVYILPYHKDLTAEDYHLIGGKDRIQEQGFYVYRNKRLMVHGTWFKMQSRNPLFENARIRVDIPNTLDDLWSIDVKKQKAIMPASITNLLSKEIMNVTNKAKTLNVFKGNIQVKIESIWNKHTEGRTGYVRYEINTESDSIKHIMATLDDSTKTSLNSLLKLIEVTIPYQDIYNSVASKLNINDLTEDDTNLILNQALLLFKKLKKELNKSDKEIVDIICSLEPYSTAKIHEIFLSKVKN